MYIGHLEVGRETTRCGIEDHGYWPRKNHHPLRTIFTWFTWKSNRAPWKMETHRLNTLGLPAGMMNRWDLWNVRSSGYVPLRSSPFFLAIFCRCECGGMIHIVSVLAFIYMMMSYTYLHTGVYTCRFVSIALKIIDQSTWWRRLHHSRGSFPKKPGSGNVLKEISEPAGAPLPVALGWSQLRPYNPHVGCKFWLEKPLGMTWNMSLCLQNPTFHIRRMIGRESGRSAWWGLGPTRCGPMISFNHGCWPSRRAHRVSWTVSLPTEGIWIHTILPLKKQSLEDSV